MFRIRRDRSSDRIVCCRAVTWARAAAAAVAVLAGICWETHALGQCSYTVAPGPAAFIPGTTSISNNSSGTLTSVALPFTVTLYCNQYSSVQVATDGHILLTPTGGGNVSTNTCLPATGVSIFLFPGPVLMPFWDDLTTSNASSGKGVFTSVSGEVGSRVFAIEWRARITGGASANPPTHFFEVLFYENQTYFDYVYSDLPSGNRSATVGAQASQTGPATQFECNPISSTGPSAVVSGTSLRFTALEVGACCNSGVCTVTASGECTGSYLGNGTVCSPDPCVGACCNAGVCTVVATGTCSGIFQGAGTTCDPEPCSGACCVSGVCTVVAIGTCSGIFQGVGTSCGPTPPCTVACCNVTACSIATVASCPGRYTLGVCEPTSCQYCINTSDNCDTSNFGQVITRVAFNSIDHESDPLVGPAASGCYNDFTAISTAVGAGRSYPITVRILGNGSDHCGVWVDWNRDIEFQTGPNPTELEKTTLTRVPGTSFFTGSIAVPANASQGATRMRVMVAYISPSNLIPCVHSQYGEVEDYTVIVGPFDAGTVAVADTSDNGNGNGVAEPGESSVALTIPLIKNATGSSAGISATLTSLSPTVSVVAGSSAYADLAGDGATGNNLSPFVLSIDPSHPCGTEINLQLSVTADGGQTAALVPVGLRAGVLSSGQLNLPRTNIDLSLGDGDPTGVPVTFNVSGATGAISAVRFRFNGDTGLTSPSLSLGLGHASVGQLRLTLISPLGVTVILCDQPGSPEPSTADNFQVLTFDDAASTSIQAIDSPLGPITGSYQPASPLSAFNGLSGDNLNGDWTLVAADLVADPGAGIDGGEGGWIRNASLTIETVPLCHTPAGTATDACCRGTTCNAVNVGTCTGQVAGSNSLVVGSCGAGNTMATCCFADFNHDGSPSIDDLFLYLNAYFTGSPWANVGGDGVAAPTIDDLFLYINAYFTGCA